MRRRTPILMLLALFLSISLIPDTQAAARKKGGKSASSAKSSRQQKSRSSKGREKLAAKSSRGSSSSRSRGVQQRASKSSRRGSRRDVASRGADRRGRKLSRRERLAEARRRAEIARRAAIARAIAIARQRAADQALRDEAAANILKDDTTGEDLEVRRVAVEALGNRAGTVVVMDPKTGRVYSVVNQEWALRRGFKPCSTIKLVSGLAGIGENAIDSTQMVNTSSGNTFSLDLTDSLAFSNNTYFQIVGGQVGFDNVMKYARELGLGTPTGINHPNESPGRVPLFKYGYAVNHMSSHGDDFEVTAIQLANMASAIGNGGTLLVPHLPRTPEENTNFKPEVRRKLLIPQEHLRRVIPGMVGAVLYGTAKGANDPTQTVAGKTGTCIGQGSWLGLFTSFAPVHDPRLAIAVITRGSGERGRIAAAVAGQIYRGLNHRFGNRPGEPLLVREQLRPKIDPSKAAEVSDEDAEADAFMKDGTETASPGSPGMPTGAGETNMKSVLKPAGPQPKAGEAAAPRQGTNAPPAATASPQGTNTNNSTTTAPTTTSSPAVTTTPQQQTPAQKQQETTERPRRVTTTNP